MDTGNWPTANWSAIWVKTLYPFLDSFTSGSATTTLRITDTFFIIFTIFTLLAAVVLILKVNQSVFSRLSL